MQDAESTLVDLFAAIADAIRSKTGETALLRASEFVDAIRGIRTDETVLESIAITENGTFEAPVGTAYNSVSVDVFSLDTSDANATENDLVFGKTAYVDGVKLTGRAGITVEGTTLVISEGLVIANANT